jgi:hypothetical protein
MVVKSGLTYGAGEEVARRGDAAPLLDFSIQLPALALLLLLLLLRFETSGAFHTPVSVDQNVSLLLPAVYCQHWF